MKPLQAVAMGLVIVVLAAPVHGYDLLADPLGWMLVLAGLRSLPVAPQRTLRVLALASLLVSAVVWFPAARDGLSHTDASLAWAAGLPELATAVGLAHALAGAALRNGDRRARTWLLTARTLLLVAVLVPPVVLGGGVTALRAAAALVADGGLVLLVVLLFAYADRPWALPHVPTPEAAGHP